MIAIRPAGAGDVAGIDILLRGCFPADTEADLVRQLCTDGDMILVLAAEDRMSGAIIGCAAFSRMSVVVGGQNVAAVALAPVAVDAGHRRQGVAEALIAAGIERLEQAGIVLCFVLGDPDYYRRFGFDPAVARGFSSPYAGDHLMALPLQGGLVPCGVRGVAAHAPAFAALS